jgi:hypothetical protein
VSHAPAAALREVRRGDDGDEIHLIDTEGRVTIVHAHGIHDDERLRTRERALQLLSEALPR